MRLDEVTEDVASLKLDFAELKSDFSSLKADIKIEISSLKVEISNVKTDVQQAINRNMQWSIGLIAFIVTALKVIDMFL